MTPRARQQARRQPQAQQPAAGTRREEWLRPLERGDGTSGWETLPMPDDQPRRPRGSIFAVDLDAEQTVWLYDRSEAAGISVIDYLKKLVDDARARGDG
jgi:hypothetical protein